LKQRSTGWWREVDSAIMSESADLGAQIKKSKPFSSYEWMIAFRYMWPRRKQGFTSLISIISFLGILIGVWALIVVMSVMNGFRSELLNRILGINGHLVMQPIDSSFTDYPDLVARLEAVEGVQFVLSLVEGQALVQGDAIQSAGHSSGALIRGVQGRDLVKMRSIAENIKSGSLDDFDRPSNEEEEEETTPSVAVGSELAARLGLMIGSDIRIISPDGDVTPFGVNPRVKSYPVAAIYEIGMYEYDAAVIFMPLEEAQLFFNREDEVQSLEIFLQNPDIVDTMRPLLEQAAGQQVYMIDWRQRNQAFFSALNVERNVMFIILSLIVLVAALNIISGLVMLVKDKNHDIAILRTMGAPRSSIMRIFIITGSTIGVGGTLFGVGAGIVTSLNIETIQSFFSWVAGIDVFNREFYFLSRLPSQMDVTQTIMVVLMALGLSFLASLLPAWRASKLDPVEALRYE